MSSLSSESFVHSSRSTAEIEAAEDIGRALADDVRHLVDLTIRTEVDDDAIRRARELIQQAGAVLGEKTIAGPFGVHYNDEGRSWNWGNTVVGIRNAFAPPVVWRTDEDGSVRSEVSLGAAYEGPPGCVHGGVSALMLDHLMGETASAGHTRMTVTGTLTLKYLRPLPLGEVHMQAQISGEDGRKVTVTAHIGPGGHGNEPAIEAHGLFIIPRWAYEGAVPADIGSLD